MDVSFTFAERHRCSDTSPQIRLGGLPDGAETLRVRLIDQDVRSFNHGGGTVESASRVIQEGALSRYTGPCPPSGTHTYEFRVDALDADGRLVGRGSATQEF